MGTAEFTSIDSYYMRRCLQLAERGITTPNPKVGCVVLDSNGRVVGEGYHAQAGQPHAEVMALRQAGDKALGGTLYVNLEPCNHYGRTPPCTHTIKQAGIAKVIFGCLDPNPKVSGSGRNNLQNNRVLVQYGLLKDDCQAVNRPFFHAMKTGMPYVLLKVALTLDGKLASRTSPYNYQPLALTNRLTQQYCHQLRQQHDGLLTSLKTLKADDARLNVRVAPGGGIRQPVPIILDRHDELTTNKRQFAVFNESANQPIWRVISKQHQPEPIDEFDGTETQATNHCVYVSDAGTGLNLPETLKQLSKQGITTLMVEAGGRLSGELLKKNLVNELVTFHTNGLLNDSGAQSLQPLWATTPNPLSRWDKRHQITLGDDLISHWLPQ